LLSFLRYSSSGEAVLIVCNFTPVIRTNVLAGVPRGGYWSELFNSDASEYGGSGAGNLGGTRTHPLPNHGMPHTLTLTVPPLGCLFLQPQ
jgi:1,4-alpha-glucan branching enzyme